jgi:hypothetical protein
MYPGALACGRSIRRGESQGGGVGLPGGGTHRSTPFRPPHRGRQAVRDYVTQAFADEQRIDDVRFDTPVVQGDRACVEYRARFLDHQGTAMTLAGCAMS